MARHSYSLPFFPLGVFLLPGERTGLHIFEPRYRQLIEELERALESGLEGSNRFGIPFHYEDMTASTGSLARLVEVKKVHPGGRKDIVVECVGHFETQKFQQQMESKLYPGGHVVNRDMNLGHPLTALQRERIGEIKTLLQNSKDVDVDQLSDETLQDLTQWLGLPPAQKHRLLILKDAQRAAFIDGVLRWTKLVLQQEVHIHKGFFPN
jgi:Lon protease-like protein